MTTLEIGTRLVELCAKNENKKAVEELYADDIVSTEAFSYGGRPRVTTGKAAVLKNHDHWFGDVIIHSNKVLGPYLHGDDEFAVFYEMDVTMKSANQRMLLKEVGLYTVAGGKVKTDRFFNTPM